MKKILLSLLVATAGSTFAADTTPKNTTDTASKNTNAPASDLETAAKGSDTTPAAKTVDNNSILPTINKDTVQGSWEQLKGSVKEMYGKLTDNDLTEINGSMQKLAGKLQSVYGMTKEEATKKANEFFDNKQQTSSSSR